MTFHYWIGSKGQKMFYELEHIDLLKEYEGRLLIEWGKGATCVGTESYK